MARRGRKRQLDVEAQYWALLANRVGTVEDCRILGIGRKTPTRSSYAGSKCGDVLYSRPCVRNTPSVSRAPGRIH